MKHIPLTQGLFATVDDEDFEALNQYKWQALKSGHTFYAERRVRSDTPTRIWMHRAIAGTPTGMETDHVDGDGLNNVRSNLRVTTKHQNQHNRTHKKRNASSQFRGVSWDKTKGKWNAEITTDGKKTRIGLFASEHDAARAYDAAGMARDPEHFTPNFPHQQQDKK